MIKSNEKKLGTVNRCDGTKQPGEARPGKWEWVEHSVWSERMLETLDKGVKGGVWFSLIDKVYRPKTLYAGWKTVKRQSGCDHRRGQSHPWGMVRVLQAQPQMDLSSH